MASSCWSIRSARDICAAPKWISSTTSRAVASPSRTRTRSRPAAADPPSASSRRGAQTAGPIAARRVVCSASRHRLSQPFGSYNGTDMVDLHLHTTASDGHLSPAELVAAAREAGRPAISITDHDTTAGIADARASASEAGIELVPGIEISAVDDGRDLHLLGYFVDPESSVLREFLDLQRAERARRIVAMTERL